MNQVEVVINVDQLVQNQKLKIDPGTSIQEIISFIEQTFIQREMKNLIWQAFSQTIEKLVPLDYQLKIQNEILNFTFEKMDDITTEGQEIKGKKTNEEQENKTKQKTEEQEQENKTQQKTEEQENKRKQTTEGQENKIKQTTDGNKQYDKICKIISVDQNHKIKAEFPKDSQIKDILLYIKSKLNIPEDIERWVCIEYNKESQLKLNQPIQDIKEMIIEVSTIISLSQMKKFKQENFHLILDIYITKEKIRKNLNLPYSRSKTLKDLELLILRFVSQQQDGVKVNIKINDQQYNIPENSEKTFAELNILNNTLIEATIIQNA